MTQIEMDILADQKRSYERQIGSLLNELGLFSLKDSERRELRARLEKTCDKRRVLCAEMGVSDEWPISWKNGKRVSA